MSKTQYINTTVCLKNIALILVKNGKKFDTMKELAAFALSRFTPEQIDETIADMPFCEDKKRFWNAATSAFIATLEETYRESWQSVCPEEAYEVQEPVIDAAFNEEVGVFDYFFHCVEKNAKALKLIEGCGLGDILEQMGGE